MWRGCIWGLFLLTGTAWPSNLLYNGGFQNNNLNGWTPFTTSNGSLGTTIPTVVPFTAGGTPSNVAEFEVGQTSFLPGDSEGGGIEQTLTLPTGQLTLSADVSFYNASTFANSYAGEAILLIDNVAVASYTAGMLNAGQLQTASLSYSFVGDGQPTTIGLEFVRPALSEEGETPYQEIYGIDLEDPPGVDQMPEPGTWLLAGLPLGLAAWRLRKRIVRR